MSFSACSMSKSPLTATRALAVGFLRLASPRLPTHTPESPDCPPLQTIVLNLPHTSPTGTPRKYPTQTTRAQHPSACLPVWSRPPSRPVWAYHTTRTQAHRRARRSAVGPAPVELEYVPAMHAVHAEAPAERHRAALGQNRRQLSFAVHSGLAMKFE